VLVRDGNDQPQSNIQVTLAITSQNATPDTHLHGTTTQRSDSNGLVTFSDLWIDQPGSYMLTASTTGRGDGASDGPSISVQALQLPLSLEFQSSQDATVTAGAIIPKQQVLVRDGNDQPQSNIRVTLAITSQNSTPEP
jgi:hypothetical protein